MSVLDNVIKLRALEQDQNQQNLDSFLKGVSLVQERQKTNILADIQSRQLDEEVRKTNILADNQKKQIVSDLAKSGLQWNDTETAVTPLPSEVLQGISNMKDAMMSPTDRALKESLLETRTANAEANRQKQADEDIVRNMAPLTETATDDDKAAWLGQLPSRDASLIKSITDYNYDVWRGLSLKDRERLGGLATMYDPTFSMTEFEARKDYKKQFSGGKIGANIRSYNTVLGHLGSLQDVVENKDLPSSSVRLVEKAKRGISKQVFGSGPEATAMADENSAINAVAGELATVFKNSGGTDQEIDKWFQSYDKDATKAYKTSWIKKGLELVNSRMDAISYDYERVMKKPVPKDQSIISPKAQIAINRIEGKKQSSAKVGTEWTTLPNGARIRLKQ